jgi:hypothetical protein
VYPIAYSKNSELYSVTLKQDIYNKPMNQLNNCPICNTSAIGSFIKTTAQMHSKELFNFDQCAECKLVFLNPRVSLDVLQNYYTSHYRTGDQKRGVSLKISGKQPAKVRFKR